MYRGFGVPNKDAIDEYRKMKETSRRFRFNGFTSTSIDKKEAEKFSKRAKKRG